MEFQAAYSTKMLSNLKKRLKIVRSQSRFMRILLTLKMSNYWTSLRIGKFIWYTTKVARMSIKKVAVYVDDEAWNRFKEVVLRKYGTTRMLSKEVQRLIDSYLANDIEKFLRKFSSGFISREEVKKNRPELRISAGKVIREMRDEAGLP